MVNSRKIVELMLRKYPGRSVVELASLCRDWVGCGTPPFRCAPGEGTFRSHLKRMEKEKLIIGYQERRSCSVLYRFVDKDEAANELLLNNREIVKLILREYPGRSVSELTRLCLIRANSKSAPFLHNPCSATIRKHLKRMEEDGVVIGYQERRSWSVLYRLVDKDEAANALEPVTPVMLARVDRLRALYGRYRSALATWEGGSPQPLVRLLLDLQMELTEDCGLLLNVIDRLAVENEKLKAEKK